MPYLNETGLAYYSGKLKPWIASQPVKTLPSTLYPWTLTDKAGAVTCWPVGGTELRPTVDFLFTETPPASGDKGPENPSTITGVESVKVTRCGKNLCPLVNVAGPNVSTTGVTVLVDAVSGSISISGKATANGTISFVPALSTNFLAYGTLRAGKTYTFSLRGNTPSSGFRLRLFVTTTSSPSWSSDKINVTTNNSSIYTLPDDIVMAWLRIDFSQDTDFGTGCTFTVQIEEGETATEFEPYFENKYTLPLGSTYYGGSIDLATGLMTVTVSSDSISGFSRVYNTYTNTVSFIALTTYPHVELSSGVIACSNRFDYDATNGDTEHWRLGTGGEGYRLVFYIDKARLDVSGAVDPSNPTNAEWTSAANAWLNNNPIDIVYELLTPSTVQLDPATLTALAQSDKYTPRLNTIYTDASAVQVGYVKSPIREEYELQQAIVSQGGNV